MHHALEIQEILYNIIWSLLSTCYASSGRNVRAFEEPALDVLWVELRDSSPWQCLPEASYRISEIMIPVRHTLFGSEHPLFFSPHSTM